TTRESSCRAPTCSSCGRTRAAIPATSILRARRARPVRSVKDRRTSVAGATLGALVLVTPAAGACRRSGVAKVDADSSRLPEDPVEGKRAEAQWREHMADEEHERQIAFDGQRVAAHRSVVALLLAARGTYDRAATEAALATARSAM